MSLKLKLALFSVLVSTLIHGYLTSHYYPLHYGLGSENAFCNLSATFNCDAVSASSFSNFLGIPLSVWGLSANLILLFSLFVYSMGLSDSPALWGRFSFLMILVNATASVVMAAISFTMMTQYCILCIGLYLLAFLTLGLTWKDFSSQFFKNIFADLGLWLREKRIFAGCLVALPLMAFLLHQVAMANFGAKDLERNIQALVSEWKARSPVEFPENPSLLYQAENEVMKIVEFADFRCGHCKNAAPSLHAFKSSHKGVSFAFYSFPLDGQCNSAIPNGDGLSCRLAKATFCANAQDFGWQMHDLIFEHQSILSSLSTTPSVDEKLRQLTAGQALNWDQLSQCMDAASTHAEIQAQAEAGVRAKVRGTPSVFVNGRRLDRGQNLPVLRAVYKELTQ